MSSVFVDPNQFSSHTSAMIRSRVTTRPASRTSSASRSNSFGESSSSSSSCHALRAATSTLTSAAWNCSAVVPPQLGAHARQQLGEAERLGDVVVGARVEAADGVHLAVLRGEEHDRDGRAALAHALADLEAVDAGQPDVEDQQVVLAVHAGRDGVRSRRHGLDLVPLALERADERHADALVVLSEQDQRHGPMVRRTNPCVVSRPAPLPTLRLAALFSDSAV